MWVGGLEGITRHDREYAHAAFPFLAIESTIPRREHIKIVWMRFTQNRCENAFFFMYLLCSVLHAREMRMTERKSDFGC